MASQSSWIMARPFSGKENEDFEAFLLDFDNACDANGWDDTTVLARPVSPAPIRTRGETSVSHYTVTPPTVTSTRPHLKTQHFILGTSTLKLVLTVHTHLMIYQHRKFIMLRIRSSSLVVSQMSPSPLQTISVRVPLAVV